MPSAVCTSAVSSSFLRICLSFALKRAKPALVSVRTKRPILSMVQLVSLPWCWVEIYLDLKLEVFKKVSRKKVQAANWIFDSR